MRNINKQVDHTQILSMALVSLRQLMERSDHLWYVSNSINVLQYNQPAEEQLEAGDTSDNNDHYHNQKFKEQYMTGSTQIQTPSQISALALEQKRKKSMFSNIGAIQDRAQIRRTFTHKDRSSVLKFERHFSPEPLARNQDENFKAYNDQISYSQKRYKDSDEVIDYEQRYQDKKINPQIEVGNYSRPNSNLKIHQHHESQSQIEQSDNKANTHKEPEPESIPINSNTSTSFIRPITQENYAYRNQFAVNNVIYEENSIMGASQAFEDKYANNDNNGNNIHSNHYHISLLEQAIIDMDVTSLIQEPAAKKTLMMRPKQKNHAIKNDSKFRINSATARRNLNAMSTINDESRMTNFIQNENYEINSFRSNNNNDKNTNQQQSQPNTQSIEALRESWNCQQIGSMLKKEEQQNQIYSKTSKHEKLNITMDQINQNNIKVESTTSKNLLFNKARQNNINNQSNIMSYQELKGNQTQKNKLITGNSYTGNRTLISAHSRRRNNDLIQSNYKSLYNANQFHSMNQSNSLVSADMKRIPTLTSNPDSNINKFSIKDYHINSLTQQQSSYPQYQNLDLSYQLAKQGGRKNLSNDLMMKLNQQKSLSRKRTAFSSQNERSHKKNQDLKQNNAMSIYNEDILDKKNLNYAQQISMNTRGNANRNKRIIINERTIQ